MATTKALIANGAIGEVVHIHQPCLFICNERFPTANQYKTRVEAFGAAANGGPAFPWTLEQARGTQAALDKVFDVAGVLAP